MDTQANGIESEIMLDILIKASEKKSLRLSVQTTEIPPFSMSFKV